VRYSFIDLLRIEEQALLLRNEGVHGAELIVATYPDYRDNRAVIRIAKMDEVLLRQLAARYGGDAIAIEVLDVRPEG
jgi:hypothetical protein